MKPTVLFVDDEETILQALQRALRPMAASWELRFAHGGREALDLCQRETLHAVVSDLRMPGMSGTELLAAVAQQQPLCARVLLSGHVDDGSVLNSLHVAHACLMKPCRPTELRAAIERSLALRQLLSSPALEAVWSRLPAQPPLPERLGGLFSALADAAAPAARVVALVAGDEALALSVRGLANSPLFAPARPIADTATEVGVVGPAHLRGLALFAAVAAVTAPQPASGLPARLLRHSQEVACLAARIMDDLAPDGRMSIDLAITAGLVHDVGRLVLARLPDGAAAAGESVPADERVRRESAGLGGIGHAEVGARWLATWGLSDAVVETVAHHHAPGRLPAAATAPVVAVHVADALLRHPRGRCLAELPLLETTWAASLPIDEHLPDWLELRRRILEATQVSP